jgi:hypothetical protein
MQFTAPAQARKNHTLTDPALHPTFSQNIMDNIDLFIFFRKSCGQGEELYLIHNLV